MRDLFRAERYKEPLHSLALHCHENFIRCEEFHAKRCKIPSPFRIPSTDVVLTFREVFQYLSFASSSDRLTPSALRTYFSRMTGISHRKYGQCYDSFAEYDLIRFVDVDDHLRKLLIEMNVFASKTGLGRSKSTVFSSSGSEPVPDLISFVNNRIRNHDDDHDLRMLLPNNRTFVPQLGEEQVEVSGNQDNSTPTSKEETEVDNKPTTRVGESTNLESIQVLNDLFSFRSSAKSTAAPRQAAGGSK